jgi:hypothetical protein
VTPRDEFARVVYRSGDGHIHELYYKTGQGWGHADLSAATNASAAAGDPAAYVYRSGDGHTHELYYKTSRRPHVRAGGSGGLTARPIHQHQSRPHP